MNVILKDGNVLESEGVHGMPVQYQGIMRDSLTFIFDPEKYSLEHIDQLFTEENCSRIGLQSDDCIDYHENYVIRLQLSKGYPDTLIGGSRDHVLSTQVESLPVYITIKMAQLTYLEKSIREAQEVMDAIIIDSLSKEVMINV